MGGGFKNRVETVPIERRKVGVYRDSGGREVVAGWACDRFDDGGDLDSWCFAGADGACDFGSDCPQAGNRELQ